MFFLQQLCMPIRGSTVSDILQQLHQNTASNYARTAEQQLAFLARYVIYTSRAYAMMPVRLSVTEVHWRIIANLRFKFRSHFANRRRSPCCCGLSRTMLAGARLSCFKNHPV